jgi:FlaG/FlaF family flagellin (archaellin)
MILKNFFKNDDAVAVSIGFIITFAITVIVFCALIISFYSLTQSMEKSAMRENFKMIGSGLATKLTAADLLVNITNSYSGTVNMLEYEFTLPASIAGKTYTINITKSPYKLIFEVDNGARYVSLFNTSNSFTPVVLYSASEYFLIKYNQSTGSLYIVEQ